jgi:hypothetical protein
MGGSTGMFQQLLGGQMQAPQYQNQNFGNNQVLDYAKSNHSYDDAQAYKNEVVNQLRNNSYKDPYGVWSNVMNAREQTKFNQAQQQPEVQPEYTSIDYSG